MPTRARLSRRLLVSLGTLVVLLGGAEGVARLLPNRGAGGTRGGYVVPDPELLWRLAPATDGPLATNELGLRDAPYRADADVKVLLLGDSVAWGDGVRDLRACFPYRLERLLDQRRPGRTHEVINAAVPGYATFQEKGWLEHHGLALAPDLVVLQFCLNDVTARYQVLAQYGGDDVFLGIDTRAAVPGVHGFLLRNSRAYQRLQRLLQRRAREREAYDVRKLTADPLSPELEEAWAVTLAELDELRALCAANDLPLVVAIVPYAFQLQRPKKLRQPQERLLAALAERGVPGIDLLPPLAAARDAQPLFRDPSHLSEAGHAVVARVLAEALRPYLPGG